MSLSRKDLEAMGIEPEKIESIIAAHIGVVNALKDERDALKAKADQLDAVQKQLDELKTSGDDWQGKYEAEHTAFEQYKASVAEADTRRAKEAVYKDAMRKASIPEKIIDKLLKIADVDKVKLEKDGKPKNIEAIEADVKEAFGDYITTESTQLDKPDTPPTGNTGKDAFNAMSLADQMRYANEHPDEVKNYF